MPLLNTDVAELLARAAEGADGHRRRAYASAATTALLWDEEVADVVAEGRSPAELERIGPSLAKRIRGWVSEEPDVPEPPPVRRGFRSFAQARAVESAPLRGDLQMHTVHSDGQASVREMALTSAARGYEYVAVTDHSHGLRVVRGMDEEALAAQGREIDAVNAELAAEGIGLTVLRSIEMNLDPDGNGDLKPGALAPLDLVLGSFHSQLRRTEDQTERYLAALGNPFVDVIGHPRGRKYNLREGLQADWARVAEAAAAAGVALETNAYPNRQDLSVELLECVRDAGGWVSIGTDAHDPSEMRFLDIGASAVLEAGIPRERVMNALSRDELLEWVAARRERSL